MGITRLIEIVPTLRSIELLHVGCWEQLNLEFIPGLNIITEESSAWGKTTIFRAILQALLPSTQAEHPLSVTIGFSEGRISVEFMSPTVTVSLGVFDSVQLEPGIDESHGQFMFRYLRSNLEAANPNTAVLVENEVLAVLDRRLFAEAVNLLNDSRCQVICQIAHNLDLKDFPDARVYACSLNHEHKASMRLLQPGCDEVNSAPNPHH